MNMSNQNVLPLLAFQHHVGSLFIAPEEIEFVSELGVGDLAIVEKGRWHRSNADGRVCSIVVKGYKPFVIGGPEDFRELLLEASKLHRLRHPCVSPPHTAAHSQLSSQQPCSTQHAVTCAPACI